MAKETTPESPGAGHPPSKSSFPLLPLLNSVVLIGALGFLYYSKIVFKRPVITEETERDRLAQEQEQLAENLTETFVEFPAMTVNILATPSQPNPYDNHQKQSEGKLHYITLAFSLQIRDENQKDVIEGIRPFLLDRLNQILGKKGIQELITVQGRYLLHTEILEISNEIIKTRSPKPPKEDLVTNVFFTQFTAQ